MDEIRFKVQGSEKDPYLVIFQKKGSELLAFCSCAAGEKGQYCKHRFNILDGQTDRIVSSNIEAAKEIQKWLSGSKLESERKKMRELEQQVEAAKKSLALSKKKISKIMHQG